MEKDKMQPSDTYEGLKRQFFAMKKNPNKLYKPISEFEWKDASDEELKEDSLPHYADKFKTMENIKTPVQKIIESEKKVLNYLQHEEYNELDPWLKDFKKNMVRTQEERIKQLEFILPIEREMIEKAHLDGQKRSHSPSKEVSEIYYTRTFES